MSRLPLLLGSTLDQRQLAVLAATAQRAKDHIC
jgi:hypothetical protein